MFATKPYNRLAAIEYARRWALDRNPLFSNFTGIGGDCTNFVSQCIFAGSCVMNGTPTFGWYYRYRGEYAPAWTGVEYLYNFLTTNMENGPYAVEVGAEAAEVGDIVQLGRGGEFYHTLMLTGTENGVFLIAAHSNDALDRRLDTYSYEQVRYLHILGVRFTVADEGCCFDGIYNGTSIFPTLRARRALSCVACEEEANPLDGMMPPVVSEDMGSDAGEAEGQTPLTELRPSEELRAEGLQASDMPSAEEQPIGDATTAERSSEESPMGDAPIAEPPTREIPINNPSAE